MRLLIALSLCVFLPSCITVNSETVKDMPTGYICELLGPNYSGTSKERRALYAELERREMQCVAGGTQRILINQ
jgi:hypothetical protein